MPIVNSFADTYLPSYARGKRDVGGLEYDFLFQIDILYEERKKLKRVEPYYEWFYREPDEQVRPFIGYRDRSMYAFQTARHVALMGYIVGNITPYRLMVARTGTVYVRRKPTKFYTKSFVGHVVRNWGYDLR